MIEASALRFRARRCGHRSSRLNTKNKNAHVFEERSRLCRASATDADPGCKGIRRERAPHVPDVAKALPSWKQAADRSMVRILLSPSSLRPRQLSVLPAIVFAEE